MSVAVYYLIDPRTDGVRYVGYSKDPVTRFRSAHLRALGDTHKCRWVQELRRERLTPCLSVRCLLETREEAKRIEIALISKLRARGVGLTNKTSGGDGGDTYDHSKPCPLKGRTLTIEHRTRLSQALKGRPARNKGKPAVNKGKPGPPSPWKGQKREGQFKHKGRPLSEKHKEALRDALYHRRIEKLRGQV